MLADLRAIGGIGSFHDFERHAPGRYDPRYFNTAMDRLTPSWVKYAGRSRFFGSKVYVYVGVIDGDVEQLQPGTRVQRKDVSA